jgi:hypothetical protein
LGFKKPCAWNLKTIPKGFEITGSWEKKKSRMYNIIPHDKWNLA